VHGVGSDIQAFGYDETEIAERDRPTARAAWRDLWRACRQELFIDGDGEPFATIDWRHTIDRIAVVHVAGGRAVTERQIQV